MKFLMRLAQEFEAEDAEAAQEFVMDQIRNGIQEKCMIELAHIPTEDEEKAEQEISFHDLLNNLNSGDMTKN